ncbi:MAG TPA: hypothetical protein VD883_03595 [Candidatus Omnitrophota bacterium]|nr:hypothetical protein [Candidatus Omnitrophota bacterium]
MNRTTSLTGIFFTVFIMLCAVSGLSFANDESDRQTEFDLKSRQPIMSPPGVPIGPIMPAGRAQQHGIEEIPAGNSPKSCSIKDFLFPWTRESEQ